MARVTRIQRAVALAIRHKVSDPLEGVHASLHVGRSLDFNDLREYVVGDEVSDIDWRATARSGTLLVKRHIAERRSTLLIAVATGRDMAGLATPDARKVDVALDAAATLGVLATSFGDYAGALWCDGETTRAARPSTRLVELERQLGLVERTIAPDAQPVRTSELLATAARTLRRRAVVAVIADDVTISADLESRIRRLAAQHQVLWLTVPDVDPTDPALGGRPLLDLGEQRLLPDWLDDEELRREVREDRARRAERRSSKLSRLGVAEAVLSDPSRVALDVISLVRRQRRAR
ncbi:DUF58 domain-containing protein [Tessaracoccus caeni]|uniref:DUF58 domain-containing protein n=1 Tax=Tessaracoccus caeni TaxID=3031239 RepID=UPI0023DB4D95|nr:DUF58 domain-containing protein [Tessaracoccus caeni]MDF1488300.1 DUF58 domain-containing protein [Tessaracoccus caeni]